MRTTPTQICWTKAILGRACHPMPLGKNLACDKFNHGSLTKDAVVHHIEPCLLTQPRWGIQSRSRWRLTKYRSTKGSYPLIENHPHHDGLDSLFYLRVVSPEREWITRRALTLLLNILHSPIRHLIHCIAYTNIHRQIQRVISSLFYVFLMLEIPTIDNCFTISSLFYVFM